MADIYVRRSTVFVSAWAMLQGFPLALFTAALITDLAYVNTAQIQWTNFSAWLIAGGLFVGGFAILAGAIAALFLRREIHWRRALLFTGCTLAAWVLALVNMLVHGRDGWTSVWWTGLALSAATAALTIVASWIGYSDSLSRRVIA